MDRHGNHPEPSSQPDAYHMQGYGAAVGVCLPSPYLFSLDVASQNRYGTNYPTTPDYGFQNVADTQYTGFPNQDLDVTQLDRYLDNNAFTWVPASTPSQPLNARPLAAPFNLAAPIAAPNSNTQHTGFPIPDLGFTRFDGYLDNNPFSFTSAPARPEHINAGPVAAAPFQDNDAGPVVVPGSAPLNAAAPIAAFVANRRLPCTHAGCTQSFQHQHDLTRHMKGHKTGAKDFNCPYRDCPRQGLNGFTRKDKLVDHLKGKHKWQLSG